MLQLDLPTTANVKLPRFVTVDAESDVVADGVAAISELRDSIEEEEGVRLPIVWFVRFQRSWSESVTAEDPEFFGQPPKDVFDGFALARPQWLALQEKGDEIAWHYHAYHYVRRDDLSHTVKMQVLNADLAASFRLIETRHPEFRLRGFRFGWFFVPDYQVYETLYRIGIRFDSSVDAPRAGRNVGSYNVPYLPYLVDGVARIGNVVVFPKTSSYLIHDWTVVPHQFSWHRLDSPEAEQNRIRVKEELRRIALRKTCMGYSEYLGSRAGRELFSSEDLPREVVASSAAAS